MSTLNTYPWMLSNQHLDMPHLWGGMDYLGKGEVLTITDLDRFVNNIWEKCLFCVYRKCFRSLSSSHEKWEQKQKCCIYIFVQCILTICQEHPHPSLLILSGHHQREGSDSWIILPEIKLLFPTPCPLWKTYHSTPWISLDIYISDIPWEISYMEITN